MLSAGRSSHELLAGVTVCVVRLWTVVSSSVLILSFFFSSGFTLFHLSSSVLPLCSHRVLVWLILFLSFLEFFVFLCPFPSLSLVPVMSSSISLCSDVFSSVCPLLSSPSSHCFPPCSPSCSLQFCYFLLCPHFFLFCLSHDLVLLSSFVTFCTFISFYPVPFSFVFFSSVFKALLLSSSASVCPVIF